MDCNCIKEFDFALVVPTCNTIYYQDFTEWEQDVPAQYVVNISKLGRAYDVTVNTLGLTKLDYPGDGLYTFKVEENCGTTFEKKTLLSCEVDCCLQDLILHAETDTDWEAIDRIKRIIEGAKAEFSVENYTKATDNYNAAKKLLKLYNCNCNGL